MPLQAPRRELKRRASTQSRCPSTQTTGLLSLSVVLTGSKRGSGRVGHNGSNRGPDTIYFGPFGTSAIQSGT